MLVLQKNFLIKLVNTALINSVLFNFHLIFCNSIVSAYFAIIAPLLSRPRHVPATEVTVKEINWKHKIHLIIIKLVWLN